MRHRITIEAEYSDAAARVFEQARSFDALREAMRGIATYDGFPDGGLLIAGETYQADIRFWRLFPVRAHTIIVERVDPDAGMLVTRESHAGVRQWDHAITIRPAGSHCLWTDQIDIDAGWQTPAVARFAAYMYRHRHKGRALRTAVAVNKYP